MRTTFANKSTLNARTVRPAAFVEPPAPKPDPRVSLTPEAIRAAIVRVRDEDEAVLLRERSQPVAEQELEEMQAKVRRLELQASRLDPAKDEKLQRIAERIERRKEAIASIDGQIAYRRERAAVATELGPQAVTELVDATTRLLQALKAVKPLRDTAVAKREAVRSLLYDTAPNGMPRMVGLPSAVSSALFGVLGALEELFGKDYPNTSLLTRLLDEARGAGVEV